MKRVLICLLVCLFTMVNPIQASGTRGWQEDGRYLDPSTGQVSTGLWKIDGAYYWFDADGQLVKEHPDFKMNEQGQIIETKLKITPVLQTAYPAAGVEIGGQPIGKTGCVPTTLTMLLQSQGKQVGLVSLANQLHEAGYYNAGFEGTPSRVIEWINAHYQTHLVAQSDRNQVIEDLIAGNPGFAVVGQSRYFRYEQGCHAILLCGYRLGQVYVMDPANEANNGWIGIDELYRILDHRVGASWHGSSIFMNETRSFQQTQIRDLHEAELRAGDAPKVGNPSVSLVFQGHLLEEGVDYLVQIKGQQIQVTGKNAWQGELVTSFERIPVQFTSGTYHLVDDVAGDLGEYRIARQLDGSYQMTNLLSSESLAPVTMKVVQNEWQVSDASNRDQVKWAHLHAYEIEIRGPKPNQKTPKGWVKLDKIGWVYLENRQGRTYLKNQQGQALTLHQRFMGQPSFEPIHYGMDQAFVLVKQQQGWTFVSSMDDRYGLSFHQTWQIGRHKQVFVFQQTRQKRVPH